MARRAVVWAAVPRYCTPRYAIATCFRKGVHACHPGGVGQNDSVVKHEDPEVVGFYPGSLRRGFPDIFYNLVPGTEEHRGFFQAVASCTERIE